MSDRPCRNCGSPLPPTSLSARIRCDYCGADNLLDSGQDIASLRLQDSPVAVQVRRVLAGGDPQRVLSEVARRLGVALGRSVAIDAPEVPGTGGPARPVGRALPSVLEDLPEDIRRFPLGAPEGAPRMGRVAAVRASVGEYRLELQVLGGRISGRRSRIVRGTPVDPLLIDERNLANVLAADLVLLGEGVVARFLS